MYSKLFSKFPLSRESGEKYKKELLSYGGGRDPWTCVGAVLDQPHLANGDKAAMDTVGKWSIDQDQ